MTEVTSSQTNATGSESGCLVVEGVVSKLSLHNPKVDPLWNPPPTSWSANTSQLLGKEHETHVHMGARGKQQF